MKALITVSLVAGLLLAAVRWSGQSIDAGSVFAIVVASFLTALFVRDYRTPPGPARAPKPSPVRRSPARAIANVPVVPRVRGVMVTARFSRAADARTGAISVGS